MKLEETPNPTLKQRQELSARMDAKMQKLTPETCPYFSCRFAQTGTHSEANIAACDTIQLFRGTASNIAYGVENHVKLEAVEKPDFIIAASPTDTEGETRWFAGETHFFVAQSGAICFRADKQNWALVEAPQNLHNKTPKSEEEHLAFPFARVRDAVVSRNKRWQVSPPPELLDLLERPLIDLPCEVTPRSSNSTRMALEVEELLARLPNGKADLDLQRSLMRYPNWLTNEQLANRYHEGKDGHTVIYQPSEVELALGDAPQRALDALDRRFNELRSETVADVIDILFHHWNTHKDGQTSAVPINAAKLCEYRGVEPEGDNLRLHWQALRDAFSITLRDTKSDVNAKVFNADSKGENQDGPGARYAYRPGIFLEYALRGEPLYFAPFLQKIWALDPKKNNEAKRLARYLRGDWRMNTQDYLTADNGEARAARWHSWAFLLAEMGIDVEAHRQSKNPSRLIEMIARAVETLYQMEAIAEGGFDIYHAEDRKTAENLPRRGAIGAWLALRVCLAPSAKLREALLKTDGKRRAGRARDANAVATERAKKRTRAENGKAPRIRKS